MPVNSQCTSIFKSLSEIVSASTVYILCGIREERHVQVYFLLSFYHLYMLAFISR